MSDQNTLTGTNPFFDKINKFDDKPKESKEDEMIGKSSNRKLEKPWNIKIQVGVDFFNELFAFIDALKHTTGYDTVLGLTSKQIKIFKLDPSNTHLSYITLDKTEVSEYINTDNFNAPLTSEINTEVEKETLIYVDFSILDEINLNNKYPVDIYFDTKVSNTMYIVNAKTIESKRLNDASNNDATITNYPIYFEKIQNYIKNENTFDVHISHISFKNVLTSLDKKKTKKDKKSSEYLQLKFGLNDIDFLTSTDTTSSSIQMYGDDIIVRGTKEVSIELSLDFLTKFNKLKLMNNVILHVNSSLPFILETKFGAGRIKLYYMIAPRSKEE